MRRPRGQDRLIAVPECAGSVQGAACMTPVAYLRAHHGRFVAELRGVRSVCQRERTAGSRGRRARVCGLAGAPPAIDRVRSGARAGDRRPARRVRAVAARPGRPTLLVYGHYDVQPPDPLAEWTSPPFEPAIRGDNFYGRGAADDKGQLFIHLKALESLLRTSGSLPLNVTCLFEGEEEIGSPHLPAFIRQHRPALVADAAVVSDKGYSGPDGRRSPSPCAARSAWSWRCAVR